MQGTLLHHLRSNAVAYLALFVALGGTSFAAATVITGKNVKDSSLTGADVKNSSLTGKDVKDKSLRPADFNGSVQGPKGDPGPKGDTGPQGQAGTNGTDGTDGTDATINGVAAGGALTGTYPNPGIADDAITTAKLAPGMQEATLLDVPRGTAIDQPGTIGPLTGPFRIKIACDNNTMQVRIQKFLGGTGGELHATYVRGTNTVKRVDNLAIGAFFNSFVLDTFADTGGSPGNDSGTGTFIGEAGGQTVSGTFTYLADGTHCRLLGAMHLMQ